MGAASLAVGASDEARLAQGALAQKRDNPPATIAPLGSIPPCGSTRAAAYERRLPEETTLYRLVREHLETFLARVEAVGAASLPQFVKDEFDAFLECGILAHGFLRLCCAECGHEKLVAFSCKRRGICPSCGARRRAETAAWLVDRVIPRVPVRQWVLSFPIPLRSLFAVHPELLAPVLQIIHRAIATHLIRQTGVKRSKAATGAVTLIQRFGSAANLNIHLHALVLDEVYRTMGERDAPRRPHNPWAPPPTDSFGGEAARENQPTAALEKVDRQVRVDTGPTPLLKAVGRGSRNQTLAVGSPRNSR